MISAFDKGNLDKLLKDFYTAIGIRISIFDDEFNMVAEYPETSPAFCHLVRQTDGGLSGCKACDRAACERARSLRKPHIYTCHAGITEAITPIRLSGGVLGYAILAHMLPTEGYETAVEKACENAEKYGVDKDSAMQAIKEIVPRTAEQIDAAVSILDVMSFYLYTSNLVHWKNEDISANIEKYVKENLSSPLDSDMICKRFLCSRSALYQISLKTFGMGIMQYINYCRIEHAKKMLLQGSTIVETSEACGFSDYNYFCKVFRKHTGASPKEWCRSHGVN